MERERLDELLSARRPARTPRASGRGCGSPRSSRSGRCRGRGGRAAARRGARGGGGRADRGAEPAGRRGRRLGPDRRRPAAAYARAAACPPPTGCPPAGGCSSPRAARRGSSRRAGSGGGSARGRAPRGRRTGASRSSGATAGSPRSIAAGTCAGRCSRRGRSRTRCGRRAASASPTARARTCAWSPATAPATACSIPARSGRWRGGPAPRTCSPTVSGAHVDIVDVDGGARLARIRLPHVPHEIAWSADGRRLIVNLHRSLAIYDASGRRTGRIWMPGRRTVYDVRARPQRLARGGGAARAARRARWR